MVAVFLIKSRPLVVMKGNRCRKLNVPVGLPAAARSERTEWEAATCTDNYSETLSYLLAVCSGRRKTSRDLRKKGKMENESKRKMKERFGLRRDIFKEFLAEFLGIFVLIVSTSLCTCHPA